MIGQMILLNLFLAILLENFNIDEQKGSRRTKKTKGVWSRLQNWMDQKMKSVWSWAKRFRSRKHKYEETKHNEEEGKAAESSDSASSSSSSRSAPEEEKTSNHRSILKQTIGSLDMRKPQVLQKRNSMMSFSTANQANGLQRRAKSRVSGPRNSVIREVTSESQESSSRGSAKDQGNRTPRHKSKKLIIKTGDSRGATPMLEKVNSAALKRPLKGKFGTNNMTNINSMRRFSSVINQVAFNKSMANNFDLKDLKQMAKANNDFNSSLAEGEGTKLHGRALYIFGGKNKARRFVRGVVGHTLFEYFIMIVIFISSVTLAIENPLSDPDSALSKNLKIINMTMTFIFICEALLKIMAFGFLINGKDSYLRSPWNGIDFFIVIISLVSIFSSSDLDVFKVIRVMRLLRPLRVIQRNEGLKVAVQALLMAIPNILYVSVIAMLFFAIFGMTGVNMFKGQFYF